MFKPNPHLLSSAICLSYVQRSQLKTNRKLWYLIFQGTLYSVIKLNFPVFQIPCDWFGIVWHCVWCLYFTSTFFLDIFYYTTPEWRGYWYIYFRNWVYTVVVIASGTETVVRLLVFTKYKPILKGMCMQFLLPMSDVFTMHKIHFQFIFIWKFILHWAQTPSSSYKLDVVYVPEHYSTYIFSKILIVHVTCMFYFN